VRQRLKGWKAERKTGALPPALSAFHPFSLSAFFHNPLATTEVRR
jgi:hypothetical protein